MVAMSITTPVTAEQLFEMPNDGQRRELVQGEIVSMNPAGSEHGAIILELSGRMWQYVSEQKVGRLFGAETGFVLQRNPDTVRAPDVAFVCQARISEIGIPESFFPGPPDLAVEVISPSDRLNDIQAKVEDWLAHGTDLVWLIDPRRRTVAVHSPHTQARELGENDILEAPDLLPGLRLSVSDIFPTA
jgi:Uma2 family endonuclease